MKKIILPLILLIVIVVAGVFSYFKFYKCEKVDFSTIINKEFNYVDNEKVTKITIAFSKDGFFGFSGVNRYFAGYKIEGDKITFSPIGSTMMAGPQERMEAERQYFELLNKVNGIEVYKNKIVLKTSDNNKLEFKEVHPNENMDDIGTTEDIAPETSEDQLDDDTKIDDINEETEEVEEVVETQNS